jgi:hypothetical protein
MVLLLMTLPKGGVKKIEIMVGAKRIRRKRKRGRIRVGSLDHGMTPSSYATVGHTLQNFLQRNAALETLANVVMTCEST